VHADREVSHRYLNTITSLSQTMISNVYIESFVSYMTLSNTIVNVTISLVRINWPCIYSWDIYGTFCTTKNRSFDYCGTSAQVKNSCSLSTITISRQHQQHQSPSR